MNPRLWIKIDLGERGQIGPGKIALLKAIDRHHSISAAARAVGMSYRRAWLLIDALNKTCGRPVLDTHVGGASHGGANLTAFGQELIGFFESVSSTSQSSVEAQLEAFLARVSDA